MRTTILHDKLGFIVPPAVITTGLSLVAKLFGGGGKGADFPERKAMLQQWLRRENLQGSDGKYIDPNFIQQNLFQDYGSYGYPWQTVIQSYLGSVRKALNGQTGRLANPGDPDFTSIIIPYITKIKKTLAPGPTGGTGTPIIPGLPGVSTTKFGVNFDTTTLLLLGGLAYLIFGGKKRSKRR